MSSQIIRSTYQLDEAAADHFGISEVSHSFKQYGKFSQEFIQAKYEFWYEKWDNIAGNHWDDLGISYVEWTILNNRYHRMMSAWHKRLIEYVFHD